MAEKLNQYKVENGVHSIMYYEQYGSDSLLNRRRTLVTLVMRWIVLNSKNIEKSVCSLVEKYKNHNWIIESGISDIGGQVTYNENFIELIKAIL